MGSIVVCHPHPGHGGTMQHPIVLAIADEAVAHGFTAVRFNFRGVGQSTSSPTDGSDEIDDLAAVMDHMEAEYPPVSGIAGWSFGAAVALIWQARTASTLPYVGIAPPIQGLPGHNLPLGESLASARRTFIIGDRDQLVDITALSRYAESVEASVISYANTDHFFINKYQRLAEDVVATIVD
jgi:alpha/beta superfamily hydrolase